MSISRQNLSIVIVTLKSENVIHQCIESINKDVPIIVVENSSDSKFKEDLEKKYTNVKCTLSFKNLGMGPGNNLGIKFTSTDYVLILNPDVILEANTLDELTLASQTTQDFTILAPILTDKNYPNYKLDHNNELSIQTEKTFKVKNVDGFAMLLNKKKLDDILFKENSNKKQNYFDENFFMYLENNDLCKRIISNGGNIYVVPKAKINHLAAKSVNQKFADEVEFSRNWHWIWSKFYFNKKHFGFLKAFIEGFPSFFLSIFKYLFFLLINNKIKKKYILIEPQVFLVRSLANHLGIDQTLMNNFNYNQLSLKFFF